MYDIRVDTKKNRIYFALQGYFSSQEAQESVEAIKAGIDQLQPGFDVVTDLRNFQPASQHVAQYFAELRPYELEHGVSRIVRIVEARTLSDMQFERITKQTGVTVLGATSLVKAEILLDQEARIAVA